MRYARRMALAFLANVLIVVLTVISVLGFFWKPTEGFMTGGATCFRYFTTDSNILCALGSLAVCVHCLTRGKKSALPVWILRLHYSGTAAVTVTFLTVILFLGPTLGYRGMFSGNSLWLHGADPVLAILSFCLLEVEGRMRGRDLWLAMLPVVVYAGFYLAFVVFSNVWPDFYGFNVGGRWYVSAPIMLTGTALIGLGLIALQKRGKR